MAEELQGAEGEGVMYKRFLKALVVTVVVAVAIGVSSAAARPVPDDPPFFSNSSSTVTNQARGRPLRRTARPMVMLSRSQILQAKYSLAH